ncbi:MAG: Planctomycete cytochrome, partial [Verrucomicrobiales bacterium]|nr:Planctomycete cytochrome [Verrucomicrobiales bacterium]
LSSWEGDVFTVISSATYALSERTDLTASYVFSRADFGQDTATTGLPAGIVYDRHSAEAGVSHRFENGIAAGLRYGVYRYYEPSSNGVNDFTAHTVFGTITLAW